MQDNEAILRVARESSQRKHEAGEPSLRNALIIAACVVATTVVCLAVSKLMMHRFSRDRAMNSVAALGVITAPDLVPLARFPKPSLEVDDGHADGIRLQQEQLAKLNSYGWVDRTGGVVRIPSDRAMTVIAQRGLAVRTNAPSSTNLSSLQLIQEISAKR